MLDDHLEGIIACWSAGEPTGPTAFAN